MFNSDSYNSPQFIHLKNFPYQKCDCYSGLDLQNNNSFPNQKVLEMSVWRIGKTNTQWNKHFPSFYFILGDSLKFWLDCIYNHHKSLCSHKVHMKQTIKNTWKNLLLVFWSNNPSCYFAWIIPRASQGQWAKLSDEQELRSPCHRLNVLLEEANSPWLLLRKVCEVKVAQ